MAKNTTLYFRYYLYRTLTDLCNLTGDNRKNEEGFEMGGYSLKPFLGNPNSKKWEGPDGALTVIATDMADYDLHAQTYSFRTKDYRYILYPNGQEELYDLKNDPNEWINLAAIEKYIKTKTTLKKTVLKMIHQ